MTKLVKFLLTRLSRGVTLTAQYQEVYIIISTHTPLARRDLALVNSAVDVWDFYSHASREA